MERGRLGKGGSLPEPPCSTCKEPGRTTAQADRPQLRAPAESPRGRRHFPPPSPSPPPASALPGRPTQLGVAAPGLSTPDPNCFLKSLPQSLKLRARARASSAVARQRSHDAPPRSPPLWSCDRPGSQRRKPGSRRLAIGGCGERGPRAEREGSGPGCRPRPRSTAAQVRTGAARVTGELGRDALSVPSLCPSPTPGRAARAGGTFVAWGAVWMQSLVWRTEGPPMAGLQSRLSTST